jgi:predicted SnoaL-like aldol condensation-catalyzing enzyme
MRKKILAIILLLALWARPDILFSQKSISFSDASSNHSFHHFSHHSFQPTKMTNKEKVVALLRSLETGDAAPVSYINPKKYIQHNLMAGDGLQGFSELLKHKPPGGFKARVVRTFQDGDYVFTHTEYDFFGPKVGFDIFRFEDGLIVEHWDNLQEKVTTTTASGHTQTDGSTTVQDLPKTEANKMLIKEFLEKVFMGGQMNTLPNYFQGDAYIQHNPMVPDGLSGLGKAMQEMAKQGLIMKYTKVHHILGEGNFVLTTSEGFLGDKPTTYYDLFRIENGKIAEHWDVIEPLMPKEQWKNTNGKF